MSVILKGVEMPNSCFECPFMYSRRYCSADNTLDLWQGNYDELKKRVDGCPLIEVPQNSRLIDANMLEDVVVQLNNSDKDIEITRGDFKTIDTVLFEFPTVISTEDEVKK